MRTPILYVAPWVDYGGTDKGTIDWFRWIDRDRFAPSLITTQPSPNRRLAELQPYAEEIWALPDLMPAEQMPGFILDFMHSRRVGIVHLMNSRFGFDLLPDLACLPNPPAVVVQLHVEEVDRSGYVRYVTTRYGNLVDRFSVSSEHLGEAVAGYGVPEDRIRVIYTGVDPEEEFSPNTAKPIEDLPDDRTHILFPARLVEQKDPMLMLEVAAALRERDVRFQIHVVGEGHLEQAIRDRIAELGLGEEVLLYPPTPELQRWYAACDVLLLTSVFEGVPYVVFEAMAMGLPVVAPALPGNVELLGEAEEGLIEPRDSVEAYVTALSRLANDPRLRETRGCEMRDRAVGSFSLKQMASDHGELYDELITASEPIPAAEESRVTVPRFLDRPVAGTPLVSILIPHFNQTRFLADCIEAVRAQSYPEIELIVVDDCSTEPGTEAVLEELAKAARTTVLRMEENGGPSKARNAALEHCSGRYILPVDADNLLLPNAVEKLVEQLSAADEDIGFIYPNLQFFGNREDYYEVPEYNVHTLLYGNFCDTCSLYDRAVFDAARYSEGIKLGHEDWEFTLRLAELGIRGEAAHGPTVLYRKWGFNRSDEVDHAPDEFHELLEEISPLKAREPEIKAREAPSLSLIPLSELDTGEIGTVADKLQRQSCCDLELIAAFEGRWPAQSAVPPVHRIPPALRKTSLDAVRHGLSIARGAFAGVTSLSAGGLLDDPGFVEKVLRRFAIPKDKINRPSEVTQPDAIALVDAGEDGRFAFRALEAGDGLPEASPHTIIWRRSAEVDLPRGLNADPGNPTASLARLLSGLKVEWRHFPGTASTPPSEDQEAWSPLPESRFNEEDPSDLRPAAHPLLPGDGAFEVPRLRKLPSWTPALSTIAVRYRECYGDRRIVTKGVCPEGFAPEFHLGALRSGGLEGTARIVRVGDDYRAFPRGEWHSAPPDAEEIGYAETAGLPQFDSLALAVHRTTGQQILVALPEDPLLGEVDVVEILGYMDPVPARPRSTPSTDRDFGLLGLTKAIDYPNRRHRYAIGAIAEGELVGELGGLGESAWQGSVGVWVLDGRLVTERHRPPGRRPRPVSAGRWVTEPAAWGALTPSKTQVKAGVRRVATTAARMVRPIRPKADPKGDPAAWLFDSFRPGRVPLYAAYHPVTGDQLLARSAEEAAHLGFGPPELLGFLREVAPLTGTLEPHHLHVPWARRFGAMPRSG